MQTVGPSVAADTLSVSDTLVPADTLPASADSVLAVRRQLTVDSVLNSYTEDSIRAMLQANRVLEVQPDSSKMDTVRRDTTRQSKSALDQPVHYTAKDSITFDYGRSMANLYGESRVNYQNLELTADHISMAIDSSIVHATGRVDSTGVTKGAPVFKQGGDEYEPDKISYNFKSQKAFINNVYTEQGEGFLISEESKRDSMGVMYVKGGKYTTCDARHPHFYWVLTRAKVRPGKNAIFAPAYLVVEDVPLPLAIPYGFVPFSKKYSSGFIMPTYGDETRRGFYLRDGGYYFAINDNVDLKALGEIYTKGSWGLSAASVYRKRYKFSGNVYLSYQNTKDGEKNMPDYAVSKSFKVTWSHRQDAKANPVQSFSASVNFATSSYERNNLTSMYNPESYTQSTRTSSVAYSRTFSDIGLTLSGTFNLSQNMRDSSIAVTLPSLNISLSRFYPFKRKKMVGKERWYEKIAASYTGTLSNSISTKENLLFKSDLLKDWRNGMRHQVPISASFALFNYINVTPSFNFTDRMYSYKVRQSWDTEANAVQRDTIYGFNNVYNYNMSVSANTKLYGFWTPLPWFGGKKIQAVRHVFTPTVSFSYAPDFGQPRYGFWDTYVRTDANGNVSTVTYSPYAGSLYGTVSQGKTGSVSLDVSNNIEMKVRTDRDSVGYRKISLIDELGGSLSYNMAAKSRPWSDLSMRVRLKLSKSYTFSMNAVFATYAYEVGENGNVYVGDRTEWSYGRFGRFQGMSQNLSYTLNNDTFKKLFGKNKEKGRSNTDADDDSEDDEDETDPENQNLDPDRAKSRNAAKSEGQKGLDEDGYIKFSLPWSFTVSYGVSMRENTGGHFHQSRMRYGYKLTHTLNFSGNIRLSQGWNINFSSGYDFNYHRLSMTTASVSRDLHCFNMGCSMVIAPYRSYNFTFACNAGTLADVLRWKKQSSYSSNIDWY
ncbi:MAG: LPS-assembly protein LptD [Bacteroidaceae bacterium]|nr:LPS-assembly protein LptD [Bacteroidaceae bacterium]